MLLHTCLLCDKCLRLIRYERLLKTIQIKGFLKKKQPLLSEMILLRNALLALQNLEGFFFQKPKLHFHFIQNVLPSFPRLSSLFPVLLPSCHLSLSLVTTSYLRLPFHLSLPSPPSLQSHLSLCCHCAENYTSLKAVASDKTPLADIVGSNMRRDRGSSLKQPSHYPSRRTHKLYALSDSCRYIQFTL